VPHLKSQTNTLISFEGWYDQSHRTLKNYRPVSNLPFISKVLEKVVESRLENHLASNYLHDKRGRTIALLKDVGTTDVDSDILIIVVIVVATLSKQVFNRSLYRDSITSCTP
jgi:hypothetical protein